MKDLTQKQIGEYLNSKENDTYIYIHEKEGEDDAAITLGGDMMTLAEIVVDVMMDEPQLVKMVTIINMLYMERIKGIERTQERAKDNGVN